MCLETIDTNADLTKEGEGWKVFFPYEGKLFSLHYNFGRPTDYAVEFAVNGWTHDPNSFELRCENKEVFSLTNLVILVSNASLFPSLPARHYKTGFHLFLSEEDARAYAYETEIVRKVRYRKLTAKGTQFVCFDVKTGTATCVPAVVAREIFIEE